MCFAHLQVFEVHKGTAEGIEIITRFLRSNMMPALTSIGIHNAFSQPFDVRSLDSLFRYAPRTMKSAELQHVYIISDSKEQIAKLDWEGVRDGRPAIQLQGIILGHTNILNWLMHPACSLDIGNLKQLELTRDFGMLDTLLPLVRASLEKLSITGLMSTTGSP